MLLLVITAYRDGLTAPDKGLARYDSSRVMVMERDTLDEDSRGDTVTRVGYTRYGILNNGILDDGQSAPVDLTAEGVGARTA